jgi:hydroxyethylthiazole kinase-like uncharacterized protein yjeF
MHKSFRAVSTAKMQQLDHRAVHRYGIPILLLMENAGRAVAEATRRLAAKGGGKKVIVLCGGGNNGGDGVAAARYLHGWGYSVRVGWIKNPRSWEGDLGRHYRMAKALGVRFQPFSSRLASDLKKADVLVDALLGTGTKGDIRGAYREAIAGIHQSRKPVVAVDIPSGLDSDTGKPLGLAVKARITVTMAAAKPGLLKSAARPYVGRLVVADIGLPIP